VILMDINMPKMDGLEATQAIMRECPTPIVIISAGIEGREAEIAFQALRMGALTVVNKPSIPNSPEQHRQADSLISTVRAMAGVRVIHHHGVRPEMTEAKKSVALQSPLDAPEIVAIVSSTGGPAALSEILRNLPGDFPLPVVIIQHIADDFQPSMIGWLNGSIPLNMKMAEEGEISQAGTVYLAPGGRHLSVTAGKRFVLVDKPITQHIPSGDVLLESVAVNYKSRAIGVILTGMGSDGARGLAAMYRAGAYTIAQDEETSAVFGMPKEAIDLGAARQVLPITDISGALIKLCDKD